MTTDQKIEQMIKSYRLTVVSLSLIIVSMFALSGWVLLEYLPRLIHDQFVTVLTEWSQKNN